MKNENQIGQNHKVDQLNKASLSYYFDYLSPYAYFSWLSLKTLSSRFELDIQYHPVPYPLITNHWGLKGTATVPPKRAFVYRDALRYSRLMNIPLNPPATHPFKPYLPLRLSLFDVAAEQQCQVIDALWEATWVLSIDMSSEHAIRDYLNQKGLPGVELIQLASSDKIKQHYKKEVANALEQGVFGVPTMILNGELFWGRDQFVYIEALLNGENVLSQSEINQRVSPQTSWGL